MLIVPLILLARHLNQNLLGHGHSQFQVENKLSRWGLVAVDSGYPICSWRWIWLLHEGNHRTLESATDIFDMDVDQSFLLGRSSRCPAVLTEWVSLIIQDRCAKGSGTHYELFDSIDSGVSSAVFWLQCLSRDHRIPSSGQHGA